MRQFVLLIMGGAAVALVSVQAVPHAPGQFAAAGTLTGFAVCSPPTDRTKVALTSSAVQNAIKAARDGDVLCLAAGSGTVTANFSMSKGVTLAGADAWGGGTTTLTAGLLGMNGVCNGTSTKLYRITGITFSGGGNRIWFYSPLAGTTSCTLTQIRIDDNTFTGQSANSRVIQFGEINSQSYFYGVIDNNTVTNSSSVMFVQFFGNDENNSATAGKRGTINNLFIEDNTITFTTMTNAGLGCMDDTGSGMSWVWRYNTTTNCLVTSHGVTHGPWGIASIEVYGNHFIVNGGAVSQGFADCERCFHHQGSGEIIVFDNEFTPFTGTGDPGAIEVTHYRSAPPAVAVYRAALGRCDGTSANDGNRPGMFGYPCKRQPGRDPSAVLQPMYNWNNRRTDNGLRLDLAVSNPWGVSSPSVQDHIQANRDYYNAVSGNPQSSSSSPFDGTTGMGFGTLANRPTTCTAGAAADGTNGGVGYFATDQGTQGTLYRCASTNTWVSHYRPYTYPHPLRSN